MGSLNVSSTTGDSTPHVCIVGSGISGLRCADLLLQNGFQVTMLEARNRIGGRVSIYATKAEFVDGKIDEALLDMPE